MSRKDTWKQKILGWLHLTDQPEIKVYRGYGHADKLMVHGHVFSLSPLPRKKFRNNVLTNTLALLRLFIVRPIPNATVRVCWVGQDIQGQADKDGYFNLEWTPQTPMNPGWHAITVELLAENTPYADGRKWLDKAPDRWSADAVIARCIGAVYVPHPTQYGCISDIDDTFLISHSATKLKRLQVLLTENAHSRDPFDGVVEHYRILSHAGTIVQAPNPFFYVSSSEWNLYDYILGFSEKNGLPSGIYLLNQLKRFSEILKTGQNKHATKFTRIARILLSYPKLKFVLLGDDTQEDPNIYASIVSHFPHQILCVYIRQVKAAHIGRTKGFMTQIEAAGVAVCYFKHSTEAMEHTRRIGLADEIVTSNAAALSPVRTD
ncbi:App1 family protein [Nibrella viscosa]|uniref:App1 family protein n=1 Tax=Nibrella viscosa TaxID=1084524 RepID=A0ABP8K767_9BACT